MVLVVAAQDTKGENLCAARSNPGISKSETMSAGVRCVSWVVRPSADQSATDVEGDAGNRKMPERRSTSSTKTICRLGGHDAGAAEQTLFSGAPAVDVSVPTSCSLR